MKRQVVIATMWRGTRTVPVDRTPTPADLAAIAERLLPENGGVRPVVRVIEVAFT